MNASSASGLWPKLMMRFVFAAASKELPISSVIGKTKSPHSKEVARYWQAFRSSESKLSEMKHGDKFRKFQRLNPSPIRGDETTAELVDRTFLAYNAGRLREGCELFTRKMLAKNGLVCLSISGAL